VNQGETRADLEDAAEGRLNLVLLPGLDGTGLLFQPLLEALASRVRSKVIAYPGSESLSLSELARLVVKQLPSGQSVVLAESFSGLVALTLLTEVASRVRSVIFVGAFAEPPRPFLLRLAPVVSGSAALLRSMPSFVLRQYCLGKDATAAQLNLLREALAAVSPKVLAQRLSLIGARHSFGKTRFNVPAYYISASEDRLVPASCARWFEERFASCGMEELHGPHFLLQARPRESAELITRIVQKLTADGAAARSES
jgi:pimeloyl-ACP methyl ester carboxylesterase